jgi:hypothetical protein
MKPMPPDLVIDSFRNPARLYSRNELVTQPGLIPSQAGIYGWYFDDLPHGAIADIGTVVDGWSLLYIGIAPGRPGSASNLRNRLWTHLTANARRSTLRLSLGSLLFESIGLEAVAASGKVSFGATEAKLSAWLDVHARVCWAEYLEPWTIEAEVVRSLSVPLNRGHNEAHSFYPTMGEIRSQLRRPRDGS